jgi:23S rRNA pseudouridine1911/1915/1917 synthase
MQQRKIEKYYLALAEGTEMEDEFEVNKPIGPVKYPFITHTETIYAASDTGKPSLSICKVLQRDSINNRTLLQVKIPTGRPHQVIFRYSKLESTDSNSYGFSWVSLME